MNLRRNTHYTAEVYTGSLNDIMFFLLLFFLIISTLVNPSVIKLLLPNAQKTQTIAKQQVTLSITKEKTYFINNAQVSMEQLEAELSAATKNLEDATIILRVDNSLSVQDLVDVLQIGNKIKLKMVLATKTNSKE
ncbi:MAG: biopolymer transporter ExbD [Bacteroidetes bacterium RIFOXYA12_FULL_35_11]|nr:MAG: biopolymer transporter ExbD [Bacteroidetes bacterium GWF2_35_48]OFY82547.1 MAG: biopolymer transporter ExbD [Bacteroidetes bacterium RIFOXYA12_FULL_35_11]OFY93558.1 MAG: biopolymer transporter ExbD [Bacteroidetes bacterium RIFOXYC12_FULL_35_7]HBX51153.1 biopolymer transporter ExbD [Bacteroidales bacterium]